MKRNGKTAIVCALLCCMAILTVGCSNAETVKLDKDVIPTLYTVVGKKTITGTSSRVQNGVHSHELNYKAGEVSAEEVEQYVAALEQEGYTRIITGYEEFLQPNEVAVNVGKDSAAEGNVVVISMEMQVPGGFTVIYQSGPGRLESLTTPDEA